MVEDQEIALREHRLGEIAMELEFSSAVAALKDHPAWTALVNRMAPAVDGVVQQLLTRENSPYLQGRRQGWALAMRKMLRVAPLSPEDLASLHDEVTILRNQIAELRNNREDA